jgi:uracil-DNA glycosylase
MSQLESVLGDWFPLYERTTQICSEDFAKLKHVLKIHRQAHTVYPEPADVFNAFSKCQLKDTKVVIIGQDPYHNGAATGLAFGVKPGFTINPSLRIIYKEVCQSHGLEEIPDFDFTLNSWAEQGVLLLNTSLTVIKGHPNTHEPYWKFFTQNMIDLLACASEKDGIVFMLWGKFAQNSFETIIKRAYVCGKDHKIIKTAHPAAEVYGSMNAGFLGSNCFIKCNNFLDQYTTPINFTGTL